MKIAITARGGNSQELVDTRFGRAKCILIYDDKSSSWQSFDNQVNLNAAQGAGIQTAQHIVDLGADVVVTGNCGPKAFRVLSAGEIAVYSCTSVTAEEALQLFLKNELKQLTDANVEEHWV